MFKKSDRKDNEQAVDAGGINWWPIIAVSFVVVALLMVNWFFLAGREFQDRGTFGDMFGAVNALFSGLAFVGVISAIMLQSKELKLQRRELNLTTEELKGQKEQLAAQNATLRKQNFENTFFQLLRAHGEITGGIDLEQDNTTFNGRDCFGRFYRTFQAYWANEKISTGGDGLERINNTYLVLYKEYQSDIGHYFRSLYNIIKFVDRSDVDDKSLYTNLVRAQLSSYELVLLLYNSLSDMGSEKFKPLIEKYSLLKDMPEEYLINPPDHKNLYNKSAYE